MAEVWCDKLFPATEESLPVLLAVAGQNATAAGLPVEGRLKLELMLEEAAANVVHHAYGKGSGKVLLRSLRQQEQFVLELIDWGSPYNPLEQAVPDIASPLAEREAGGLGVFFIRSFADAVDYRRDHDRNILRIVMKLRNETGAAAE